MLQLLDGQLNDCFRNEQRTAPMQFNQQLLSSFQGYLSLTMCSDNYS